MADDISDDDESRFSEYQKCRQESERAVCHLGGELADKAFFYVRNWGLRTKSWT